MNLASKIAKPRIGPLAGFATLAALILPALIPPTLILATLVLPTLILATMPARAADPVYPTGSRLGLVPPPGMVQSHVFEGFENRDKNAAIVLAALPAPAFDQLDKTMQPSALQKRGVEVQKREPMTIGGHTGFLLTGTQTTAQVHFHKWLLVMPEGAITALVTVQVQDGDQTYSDQVVRDTLATLTVRASVPDAEQLSLLPFKVGDLAGFHVDNVIPNAALMLVYDIPGAAKGTAPQAAKAHFLVAALPGGPQQAADRDDFARVTFDQIGGINSVHIQDAEPLRINNLPGYQTLARAKEGQTNADVMVVQWLRFGTTGYMQMIGIAPADAWPDVFNRLRTVRDGIDPLG